MTQSMKTFVWSLVILALVIAGVLGYMIYSKEGERVEQEVITKKPPDFKKQETRQPEAPPKEKEKKGDMPSEVELKEEAKEAEAASSKKDSCARIEQEIRDFFDYLDQKEYVKRLSPEKGSFACFADSLKALASTPPVPAGEGRSTEYLVGNVYHFFRVLGQKDLRLVRAVIRKEQKSLEVNLATFYKWLMATECPDPEGLRPEMTQLYKYAGFLLNTVGGRAYLSRRSPRVRLPVSYYGILILHEADRRGKNEYGINVRRMIPPLVREIRHYPELRFRDKYLKKLKEITDYYN